MRTGHERQPSLDLLSPDFDATAFAEWMTRCVASALTQMARSIDSLMDALEPDRVHDSSAVEADYQDVTPTDAPQLPPPL